MKKRWLLFILCGCLWMLSACAAKMPSDSPSGSLEPGSSESGSPPKSAVSNEAAARLVAVTDDGELLLAFMDGKVSRFSPEDAAVSLDGGDASAGEVFWKPGMMLEISSDENAVNIQTGAFDDRCAMYLQVLEDLWKIDPALNEDIRYIGFDLSQTSLTEGEQAAVAQWFSELHQAEPLQGTFEELTKQGYIDGKELYWRDGCLFTITEKEMKGQYSLTPVMFDAQKWRSGLGAYFFMDCTSVQSANGEWGGYQVGSEAIS